MKRLLLSLLAIGVFAFAAPHTVLAASDSAVTDYTANILSILTLLASGFSTLLLIKGGYTYITSSGDPTALVSAKRTMRNALIGLVIVLGASTLSQILTHAFTTPVNPSNANAIQLKPIEPVAPQGGLTQVMIDAITGLLQNIIQSGTKPIVDGVISYLSTTPILSTNSVVFNFWLVMVGITDTLFAIIIALLGFHFMSATAFGFEEVDLKQILSRLVMAFLGANISIFLIDRIIELSNALVTTVINTTGGLDKAWVLNAFDPTSIATNSTGLLTLIFMLVFLALAIILLLYYISRLIIISLGAVLSPFIFLLWALPQGSNFAIISIKSYIVTIFTIFVHVVTIQLASSFLMVTAQSGANSLISILVAIGLLFTLLKIPGMLINMAFYTAAHGTIQKIGGQVMNVFASRNTESEIVSLPTNGVRLPARRVNL